MVHTTNTAKSAKTTSKNKQVNNKVNKTSKKETTPKSEIKPTRKMATPRSRGRGKRINNTPTRSSPRIVRRSASYPNAVNRHFVDSIPILEITLRFDEDEYDVWRRQDTDEVNLYYLLRIKYPRDEDEEMWLRELEKLKEEIKEIRIIEDGWFEGVWVPLERAKDIAQKYNIYEHVAALLESENSWFDTPKKQSSKSKNNDRGTPTVTPSQKPENEVQTNGTSAIPNNRSISTSNTLQQNGNVKPESEKSENKTPRRTSARLHPSQVKPESSKRPREVEKERDNYKEEVQSLKRKMDETVEYLNYSGSNKRRALWAGIGAAVGAGIAAVTLSSLGVGVPDIAAGVNASFNAVASSISNFL
ncbi:3282_t:CDS:2 [Diversispora eburnea]|uniref:3282_t:CDS:1 n=1 Tax=Diversispora eburnea TaxID=1213867 RepID=A0A9N9BJK7_9GLOM|nr:3282_t:CDS:2 [Diversispora eburnea]